MTSLNPLHTIERQITEMLTLHRGLSSAAARARAIELLDQVGIADPAGRLGAYPAPALGRPAPARDDRDGARQRARPPDRRRADHRARRHRAGADPRAPEAPAGRARHGDAVHHPRPRHRAEDGRPDLHHDRGRDRRARRHRRRSSPTRSTPTPGTCSPPQPKGDAARRRSRRRRRWSKRRTSSVWFPIKRGLFRRTVGHIKAVDGVDITLREGETLGDRRRVRLGQDDARPRAPAAHLVEGPDRLSRPRARRTSAGRRCGRCGATCRSSSRTPTAR